MTDLLDIIHNFKTPKVLVVGDLMLDEYLWGNVDRISPEAPIPVLDVKEINFRLGGAANTAHNVKSLGGQVFLAGVIGADEKGALLKKFLEEKGINTEGIIIDTQRKTTLKTRAVAQNQQIVRIDIEEKKPITSDIEEKIAGFVKSRIKDFNAVIISDYAKGVITPVLAQELITLAKENNILSIVDSKGKRDEFSKYRGCNIITPNKKELATALNIPSDELASEDRFYQAAKMLMAHVMADSVLVKCGGQGMTLFERDGNVFHFPALNQNPVDVSGAGDTTVGVFALALAGGADQKQAVILASHASSIGVGKMGTAVVLPEELENSLINIHE